MVAGGHYIVDNINEAIKILKDKESYESVIIIIDKIIYNIDISDLENSQLIYGSMLFTEEPNNLRVRVGFFELFFEIEDRPYLVDIGKYQGVKNNKEKLFDFDKPNIRQIEQYIKNIITRNQVDDLIKVINQLI